MKKLDRMDWKTEDAVILYRAWRNSLPEWERYTPCEAVVEALGYTDYDPAKLSKLVFEMKLNEMLNKNESDKK